MTAMTASPVAASALAPLPRHPCLAPGHGVLRRDADHLQVGLDAPRRVVAPDLPDVRSVLDALVEGRRPAPTTSPGRRVLADLLAAGLVVDADALACCVRASTDPAATRAVFARHGLDAPRRWAARGSARVGIDATAEVAGLVETLLRESGVTGPVADHDPDVVLVLRESEGEPDLVDAWARDEIPHLVVSSTGDAVTIGPFVEPGATACVRCVDAHHRDDDPRRPLVLEQHRRQSGPLVRDPLLRRLSLAWAVRDLVSWVDGDRPSSWSATVTLDARLEATRTTWSRHPYCGCGWAEPHQYSGASLPSIDRRCSREHRSQ